MTQQHLNSSTTTETSQITISTWVYISKEAVEAQNKVVEGDTLDPRFASKSTRRRIPIMEFGHSVEPHVGIGFTMSFSWEGYLGWFWWGSFIGIPFFPDYLCTYYVGCEGTGKEGWFAFAGGTAHPSEDPTFGWKNPFLVFFGTAAAGAGTAFYWMPTWRNIFPIIPAVRYDGFDDTGMKENYVTNEGLLGPHFALYAAGDYYGDYALPMSWVYRGFIRAYIAPTGRVAVIPGDDTDGSVLVDDEVFFQSFWDGPLHNKIHKTPTPTMGGYPELSVDSGPGVSTYSAYGTLVAPFPDRPDVKYAEKDSPPAIPSTLSYGDGGVTFLLTGKWPGVTTSADQEIVNTLTFSAGGFVVDSWNHIFLSIDLTTMQLTGGQDDKEKMEWVDTLVGPQLVRVPLSPPQMEVPPKWTMYVNGKAAKGDPVAKLTVYPSKDGHWQGTTPTSGGNFKMALGAIGFPLIPDDIGRYKTSGPNQNTKYAYTHIWFDKYIEPTKENLSKFFWKSKNKDYNFVIPAPDKKAAVKAFGKPHVWLYRDKEDLVEWKNLGTAGGFTNTGTKPKDYRPGPGQPKRKKKEEQ